jgi:type IV pilus assembly protein PilM
MAFSLTSLLKETKKAPARAGVLGVDIGSSAIKVVQLKDVRGVPTLETYGELQLGPYEGVDLGRGTHLPPQKMTEALIDILREAGATGKEVAFALSYNSSFTSTIAVPTLDPEKIAAMIPVEAKKYIPISLAKVSLDWFPLSVHEEDKTTHVLLSAIYNESLERYEAIMRQSGLNVVANEIEIFSSIRSIVAPDDTTVAILDCGASATRVYIVKKGVIGKTHSVLLSGVDVTHALEKTLNIEFREAEEMKRNVGLRGTAEDPRIQKTVVNSLERGLREIHTVIQRFEESEEIEIEKIILTGSGALLLGLSTYVQDMFSRPVFLADPFSKVAYPAFLEDTLKEAGPAFAVAVGVALRTFQRSQ